MFLDECGFSPSLPVNASWSLPGRRKQIPYENPKGRRVNVLAAYAPLGPDAELVFRSEARTFKAEDLVEFLLSLARPDRPATIVLDNASIHVSKVVQKARGWLGERGVELFYLPAYSPELNAIERVFRCIKHYAMPERTYTTTERLQAAVDAAFGSAAQGIAAVGGQQLRQAA